MVRDYLQIICFVVNRCISPEGSSQSFFILKQQIKIIDQSYNEVLELTNSIGTEFFQQSQLTLQRIDNMKTRYLHLHQALGNGILKEQVSEIEEILNSVIVYEKFSLSDEFQYWIQREILMVRPKNYFSWATKKENDLQGILLEKMPQIFDGDTTTLAIEHIEMKSINKPICTFKGRVTNDLLSGSGIFEFYNGNFYSGQLKNGLREGRGFFTDINLIVYYGEWKNNVKEGRGIEKYANSSIYCGYFAAGHKHGRGVLFDTIGNIYDGEWENGTFQQGKVDLKYQLGSFYVGQYKKNMKEGIGVVRNRKGPVPPGCKSVVSIEDICE